MAYCVYFLLCNNDYLYVGMTHNIDQRIRQHNSGMSVITKNRRPVRLVYVEEFQSRSLAAKREKEIKGWNRSKKNILIEVYTEECNDEVRE